MGMITNKRQRTVNLSTYVLPLPEYLGTPSTLFQGIVIARNANICPVLGKAAQAIDSLKSVMDSTLKIRNKKRPNKRGEQLEHLNSVQDAYDRMPIREARQTADKLRNEIEATRLYIATALSDKENHKLQAKLKALHYAECAINEAVRLCLNDEPIICAHGLRKTLQERL